MPQPRITISLSEEAMREIDARADANTGQWAGQLNRSAAIDRIVGRYALLLAKARRELQQRFSREEVGLILDALNGTHLLEPHMYQAIRHELLDALRFGAAQQWEVEGDQLRSKVEALSDLECAAIADAAERWWRRVDEQPDISEALR